MTRVAFACVLACALSCKGNPGNWSDVDLDLAEGECGEWMGESSLCPCFARALAPRVPRERFRACLAHDDGGFRDVWSAKAQSLRDCSVSARPGRWPRAYEKGYVSGCVKTLGSNAGSCLCVLRVCESQLPEAAFVASSMAENAGRPMAPDIDAVYASPAAMHCLDFSDDASWVDAGRPIGSPPP